MTSCRRQWGQVWPGRGSHAQGKSQEARTHKIALIGCGGRGRGAVTGALEAAQVLGVNVQVVALADYFEDRARKAGEQFGCPAERCFGGATGYQALMETDAEIVLMATPPLFRPLHLEAAVKAGKHAFIEKPVAVDPPGCRRVIAAGEEAKQKGLVSSPARKCATNGPTSTPTRQSPWNSNWASSTAGACRSASGTCSETTDRAEDRR